MAKQKQLLSNDEESSVNKIIITGRIARDAEVRYTQGGTAVASVTIASDEGYGDKKRTEWFKCALFGKRAEGGLVQYLTKGRQVTVYGNLKSGAYIGKDNGEAKSSNEVYIDEIELQGEGKGSAEAAPKQQSMVPPAAAAGYYPESPTGPEDGFNDDIPF